MNTKSVFSLCGCLALFFASLANAEQPDKTEVRQVLAPSGKLRVGLYLGTPGSMIRDTTSGETRGVGFELGRELAQRLEVPFEPVVLPGGPQVLDAVKSGRVDVAFANATPARAKEMDFSPTYLEIEAGFLVPAGSSISSISDIDKEGIRVGVPEGSTTERQFSRELKRAVLVRASTLENAIELLASRQVDAFATNKARLFEMSDKLPGSRVLDGRYAVEGSAIAIPKGRMAGMPFLQKFVEDAKSVGLVRGAAQRAGLRGIVKEPE